MRNLLFALMLAGCGSNNGTCPAPSPPPKCLPSCVASWLSVASYCAPMGTCTEQTVTGGANFCFSNGVKVSSTSTSTGSGTSTSRVVVTLNGVQCLGGTGVVNNGTSIFTYDSNACGSMTVTSTSGSNMITYNCNGVSYTINPTSADCQADATMYSQVDPMAFANCVMGTCTL